MAFTTIAKHAVLTIITCVFIFIVGLLLQTVMPLLPEELAPATYLENLGFTACQRIPPMPDAALLDYAQCVVITGGSSGIGASLALKIASMGGKVLITGRDEARIKHVVDKIPPAQRLMQVGGVVFDSSSESSIKEFSRVLAYVIDSVDCNGRLNIFLNAGMMYSSRYPGPWVNNEGKDFMFETNFVGNVKLIKSIPGLRPLVRIVFTASSQMFQGSPEGVFTEHAAPSNGSESTLRRLERYGTSKLALTALAFELQRQGWDARVGTTGMVATNFGNEPMTDVPVQDASGSNNMLKDKMLRSISLALAPADGAQMLLNMANMDKIVQFRGRFISPCYLPSLLPSESLKSLVVIFQKATWRPGYSWSCPAKTVLNDVNWMDRFSEVWMG